MILITEEDKTMCISDVTPTTTLTRPPSTESFELVIVHLGGEWEAISEGSYDSSNCTPCGELVDTHAQDSPPQNKAGTRASTPLERSIFPETPRPEIGPSPLTEEQNTVQAPIEGQPPPLQNGIGRALGPIPPYNARGRARRLRLIAGNGQRNLNTLTPSLLGFFSSIPAKISSFFLAHKEAFLRGTQLLIKATMIVLVAMTVTLPVISLDNLVKAVLSAQLLLH